MVHLTVTEQYMAGVMESLICITLNNGVTMPTLGYAVPSQCSPQEAARAVEFALNVGYRHLITESQDEQDAAIGQLLKKVFEAGSVKREDVFISAKVCIDDPARANIKSRLIQRVISLGCEYLDLLLLDLPRIKLPQNNGSSLIRPATNLHNTVPDPALALWKSVNSLVAEGHIRSVGLVCRGHKKLLETLQREDIQPQVIYTFSDSPLIKDYLPNLQKYSGCKNMQVIVEMEDHVSNGHPKKLTDVNTKILASLSSNMGRDTEQVLARSLLEKNFGVVTRKIGGKEIDRNFQIYDFSLEEGTVIKE